MPWCQFLSYVKFSWISRSTSKGLLSVATLMGPTLESYKPGIFDGWVGSRQLLQRIWQGHILLMETSHILALLNLVVAAWTWSISGTLAAGEWCWDLLVTKLSRSQYRDPFQGRRCMSDSDKIRKKRGIRTNSMFGADFPFMTLQMARKMVTHPWAGRSGAGLGSI